MRGSLDMHVLYRTGLRNNIDRAWPISSSITEIFIILYHGRTFYMNMAVRAILGGMEVYRKVLTESCKNLRHPAFLSQFK